ncbi:class II fructose-bisphosphate aldolase [Inmirania thermothiophila]|uniref:Fructose-bisphosphate aldolase class II n=1 Tax=Inmirania thermothiophila TaxID=1750597 RepID=A0A3N1Y0N3_9GAMM|nr:class II fructose-bisphosphate aldolase [Inmirania thermothiophila]ROR32376.1 fructose-bisphosphate aldolase class II [Inmirania thermothiophila]
MARVHLGDLLRHARGAGYAVGVFDVRGLASLEGVMAGAEEAAAPVILGLAEPDAELVDPALLLPAMVAAARRASVPVAIRWRRASGVEAARRAVALGCGGIALDAAAPAPAGDRARVREVVALARATGVAVEGAWPAGTADPEAAARFVAETGVDALVLAPAPGRVPDPASLEAVAAAVPVPLVVEVEDPPGADVLRALVAGGAAAVAGGAALDEAAALAAGRAAVAAEVRRRCEALGAAGRAADARAACRPWREVEHLIVYNVEGIDEAEALARMAEGRRVLGSIPGVRRVVTGRALRADARYRYCWLVRFAGEPVITTYRDHPEHVRYADERFRPVAGDRISIDYELIDDA